MYVCLCQAVTDWEIRAAAQRGARHIDQLSEALGVGICCGRCRENAQAIIAEHLGQAPAPGIDAWPASPGGIGAGRGGVEADRGAAASGKPSPAAPAARRLNPRP